MRIKHRFNVAFSTGCAVLLLLSARLAFSQDSSAVPWRPDPLLLDQADSVTQPMANDAESSATAILMNGPVVHAAGPTDGEFGATDFLGESFTPGPVDIDQTSADGYGSGGYGDFEFEFWGWLSYLHIPQNDFNSFWAYEFELALTKSFNQCIAGTFEVDFMDIPGNEIYVEQAFISVLFPDHDDSILTVGKFNAPFGVEPRDFWYRVSASRTLLFRRQPQDLSGIMYTRPFCNRQVIVRPMLVNGFTQSGFDNNEPLSFALMTEYQPNDCFQFAVTNWWGAELDNNSSDQLYFLDVFAVWRPNRCWSFAGEYLFGETESPTGDLSYYGFAAIANYDVNDCFRLFAQWSKFNDQDAFQTGFVENAKEFNFGFGWYWHERVELRSEYRRDLRPVQGNLDQWAAHLTFGY